MYDLNRTLVKGDDMYGYLRHSSTMYYDYVSIQEIPRLIECYGKMYPIEFQESLSGTFGNVQDLVQYQFVTIYEALRLALDQDECHGTFITFKGNTFVDKMEDTLYLIHILEMKRMYKYQTEKVFF